MSEPVPLDVIRAIAHPVRLAVLVALEDHEQESSELATALNLREPEIEHHLAILCDAGLVTPPRFDDRWRTIPGWAKIAASLQKIQDF